MDTVKERIEKDADELVDKHSADRALNEGRKKWYIAGATAERNKAIEDCQRQLILFPHAIRLLEKLKV